MLEHPGPSEARLKLDGEASKQVEVITSLSFIAQRQRRVDEETGASMDTTLVSLITADTSVITLPFDQTFDIRERRRFFAKVTRLEPEEDELHMQAWIDDRVLYDAEAISGQDTLRFVYQFNEGFRPTIIQF